MIRSDDSANLNSIIPDDIVEESDRYLILAGDVDPDDYEPDTTQENMERYGLR